MNVCKVVGLGSTFGTCHIWCDVEVNQHYDGSYEDHI